MKDDLTPQEAVNELQDVYPEAEVETHEAVDEVTISVEFDQRIMTRKRAFVHNETPSGWSWYKTVFGEMKVKLYLERFEQE